MTVLSNPCKPDNFESHNSLKLSFTNIWGLHSNFVDCESFLESNSPDILALCETNLVGSIDSGNFFVRGYVHLIRKDFSTHMHGLTVYVKEGLPFTQDLSLENSADSCLCFRLALFHSVSFTYCLCAWFFVLFHLKLGEGAGAGGGEGGWRVKSTFFSELIWSRIIDGRCGISLRLLCKFQNDRFAGAANGHQNWNIKLYQTIKFNAD